MTKVEKVIMRLKQVLPPNEDGTPADLTYQILSDALKREGLCTLDVLQELEDCLNVHIAYNTMMFMRVGSPKNPHTSIPISEAANIASAYYHLLKAKALIQPERECSMSKQLSVETVPVSEIPENLLKKKTQSFDAGNMCKLVSDGTSAGTKLYMPDGVTAIPFVQKIIYEISADDHFAKMTIEILATADACAPTTQTKIIENLVKKGATID